jgi:hypothetical protein
LLLEIHKQAIRDSLPSGYDVIIAIETGYSQTTVYKIITEYKGRTWPVSYRDEVINKVWLNACILAEKEIQKKITKKIPIQDAKKILTKKIFEKSS